MKTIAALLLSLALSQVGPPTMLFGQGPLSTVDVKKVQKFCDLGFRFTANGIDFDIDRLLKLGLKVDPKVLQALSSQAAVYVAELTYNCRMMAAGFISASEFQRTAGTILQYAKDLEAARTKSEKETGTPISEKPDPRLDAAQIAKEELGVRIEAAIDTQGELLVVLRRFEQKYRCSCTAGK